MHSPSVKTPPRTGCGRARGDTTTSVIPSKYSVGIVVDIRRTIASNAGSSIRGALPSGLFEPVGDPRLNLGGRDAHLGHRIALANGHRLLAQRVVIDGDAPWRADLVLAAITPTDRTAVVVEGRPAATDVVIEPIGDLGQAVLAGERQHRGLDRRHGRIESHHHAGLALDLLLAVGIRHHGERDAIGTRRSLDHVRDVALTGRGVEVLQLLARVLLVAREVEVGAVMHALDLLPAEGEFILDVVGGLGVESQLPRSMRVPAKTLGPEAQVDVPLHPDLTPLLEPILVGSRLHEELHLHLLELAGAEDEVAGGDLVAERLADLGDPEGNLLARGGL